MLPENTEKNYETIQGKEVLMSPAGAYHNTISFNLSRIIGNYLHGKRCKIKIDTFVQISDNDRVAPDIAIFCSPYRVKGDVSFGIPDFVVEITSPSTRKKDFGSKKELYETSGVKEYWIIEPASESIDVYLLKNGRYELTDSYHNYSKDDFQLMYKEQIENTKMKLKLSLYDDLEIGISDIFAKDDWK